MFYMAHLQTNLSLLIYYSQHCQKKFRLSILGGSMFGQGITVEQSWFTDKAYNANHPIIQILKEISLYIEFIYNIIGSKIYLG